MAMCPTVVHCVTLGRGNDIRCYTTEGRNIRGWIKKESRPPWRLIFSVGVRFRFRFFLLTGLISTTLFLGNIPQSSGTAPKSEGYCSRAACFLFPVGRFGFSKVVFAAGPGLGVGHLNPKVGPVEEKKYI